MKLALGTGVLILVGVASLATNLGLAHADDYGRHARRPGALFTITNEAEGNRVLAFEIGQDGSLSAAGAYATGGLGSGDSLGSQAALVLSENRRVLIAVNAGSNDISVFEVEGATLALRQRVSSAGTRPISVTERSGLVYVVNTGVPNTVAGFTLDRRGRLNPIRGSQRGLSIADAGPAQIELDPAARALVVSEKTSNKLSSYRVDAFGRLDGPTVITSAGMTPFGFEFTERGVLVVSEAATGSMSAYDVSGRGIEVISSAVSDTQKAPCWVAISDDTHTAYTANAGSASISSYDIARNGAITLKNARAAELGEKATPLDLALSGSGRYLYALDRGNTRITGYAVDHDGGLQPLPAAASGLPAFTSGLVAY
jgi:6-phosphogluconolactonase